LRRRTKLTTLALVVIVLGGIGLIASTIRYGFSAHDHPTMVEQMIAGQLRHWATPSDLRDVKNPVPLTPEVLGEARTHFADHCAICHGNDGKGQTEMGQHMYPRAPDMTLQKTQSLNDGELFSIIENGIRLTGMPGWGNGTPESGRASWTLVHFVRHMPKITAAEIAEMEKMTPRSPEEYERMKQEEEFLEGGEAPAPEHHH
jgi:mono/diheme cytochrome c family protein